MKNHNRKNVTFLWIRDPSRPVKFIRLRKASLWLVSFIGIIAVSSSIYYHILMNQSNKYEISRLLELRHHEYEQYIDHIANKDEYISYLQNELFLLSQQAEYVQLKVQELKQLEDELLNLISAQDTHHLDAKNLVAAASTQSVSDAAGGVNRQPEPAHWEELVTATGEKLRHLQSDMTKLSSQFADLKQELLERERQLRYTPSIWPVDSRTISSGYGIRSDPFTRAASFHSGTDFAGNTGDPIYSTADGTVAETGRDGQKGNYILLQHDYGWSTMYMHLSKIEVQKGDKVTKGQQIGQMGSTGRSTGPHLHYEVWQHGTPVNPALYLSNSNGGK